LTISTTKDNLRIGKVKIMEEKTSKLVLSDEVQSKRDKLIAEITEILRQAYIDTMRDAIAPYQLQADGGVISAAVLSASANHCLDLLGLYKQIHSPSDFEFSTMKKNVMAIIDQAGNEKPCLQKLN